MKERTFEPEKLTVAPGESVTWKWEADTAPHIVVGEGFISELQSKGTFAHTFEAPGAYRFRCTVHPTMKGTIVVDL